MSIALKHSLRLEDGRARKAGCLVAHVVRSVSAPGPMKHVTLFFVLTKYFKAALMPVCLIPLAQDRAGHSVFTSWELVPTAHAAQQTERRAWNY